MMQTVIFPPPKKLHFSIFSMTFFHNKKVTVSSSNITCPTSCRLPSPLTSHASRLMSTSEKAISIAFFLPLPSRRNGIAVTRSDMRHETSKRHQTTSPKDPIDDLVAALPLILSIFKLNLS